MAFGENCLAPARVFGISSKEVQIFPLFSRIPNGYSQLASLITMDHAQMGH